MTISPGDGFAGARLEGTSFRGAVLRGGDVSGMVMRGVELDGLDVDSHDLAFGTVLVNGVDVVPLVEAELDRRFPGRALRDARTPGGLREAWEAVVAAWADTVDTTPRDLWNAHVPDEWSMTQTLRHLVLATDCWLRGAVLGVEQPYHRIGQVFTGAEEVGFDVSVLQREEPTHEEVLRVRAERQQMMTDHLAAVTVEELDEERRDPWGSGWTPTVGDCLRVVLEEEWAHLRYMRRDLAVLVAG